jgi:hypothetical protein
MFDHILIPRSEAHMLSGEITFLPSLLWIIELDTLLCGRSESFIMDGFI